MFTDTGGDMGRRRSSGRGPYDTQTVEFGRRLQHYAAEKGWNQADLAREASKHLPGKKFRRDNISLYTRGIQRPGPARLKALAKALGVSTSDLLPDDLPDANAPPLGIKALSDGNVMLHINQSVPEKLALEIVAMLSRKLGK